MKFIFQAKVRRTSVTACLQDSRVQVDVIVTTSWLQIGEKYADVTFPYKGYFTFSQINIKNVVALGTVF